MNKQEAIREMNKTFPPEGFTALSTLVLYSGDIIDLKSKLASIINQIEPEKPAIPQFVADWIEANKSRFSNLYNAYGWLSFKANDVSLWVNENQDIFARAWLDGYEVEEEKRYTARLKVVTIKKAGYLNRHNKNGSITIDTSYTAGGQYQVYFTRSELEELGIWDNPAFEIEEVSNE